MKSKWYLYLTGILLAGSLVSCERHYYNYRYEQDRRYERHHRHYDHDRDHDHDNRYAYPGTRY